MRGEIETAVKSNYTRFISGMAVGVDTWATEIVLDFKKEYPFIEFWAAIPCKDQEKMWPKSLQERYRNILRKADKVIFVSDEEYRPELMLKRNLFMVDNSDLLIAVFDGSSGGTKHTYDYVVKRGIDIVRINPRDFSAMRIKPNQNLR